MVNSHLFPPSWGVPPTTQTRDYRVLPGGYGHGSTTMATWIAEKMAADAQGGTVHFPPAWGSPPEAQTRDLRPLPLGYGMGSGTLAAWIKENAKEHGGYSDQELDGPVQ